MSPPRRPHPLLFLAALPLLAGFVEALGRAWVCDDIFITFRYVDHWLGGLGLVFNPGERVEGFTHFLWVVVLAAFHRLGLDLVMLGRYLPLLAFAATLAVLARRSWRLRSGAWLGLPLGAWGLAFHYDAQLFGSSGLETAAFGLLLLLGLLVTTGERPRPGLAGALYALAALTRPEGFLYAATAGAFVLARTRQVRAGLAFAGVFTALVAPAVIFRLLYYGELLPNTFYAKSADRSYWSQGWQYTRLYFGVYLVLLVALAAVPASWILRRRAAGQLDTALLAGIQILLTALYVTRLGGDFMFARFYVPVTPLLYLVVEDVLRRTGRRWVEVAGAVLLVGFTLQARLPRSRTLVGREKVQGIVDEANYYTAETLGILRHQGEVLGKHLQGTTARVGLLSGQDAVAYFGHLPYALEGQGLTDAELARVPLAARGRPGHERPVTQEHLLRRGVHFRLRYGFTLGLPLYRQIRFDDLYGEIVRYDPALMRQLAERGGINFVPFPYFLQDYLQQIPTRLPNRLLEDYVDFQLFYFAFNDDPELLARLLACLRAAGIPEARLREAERVAHDTLVRAGLRPA